MGSEDYDSTGKSRGQDSRSRSNALVLALAAGICFGVMFSERLYLHYQVRRASQSLSLLCLLRATQALR